MKATRIGERRWARRTPLLLADTCRSKLYAYWIPRFRSIWRALGSSPQASPPMLGGRKWLPHFGNGSLAPPAASQEAQPENAEPSSNRAAKRAIQRRVNRGLEADMSGMPQERRSSEWGRKFVKIVAVRPARLTDYKAAGLPPERLVAGGSGSESEFGLEAGRLRNLGTFPRRYLCSTY